MCGFHNFCEIIQCEHTNTVSVLYPKLVLPFVDDKSQNPVHSACQENSFNEILIGISQELDYNRPRFTEMCTQCVTSVLLVV